MNPDRTQLAAAGCVTRENSGRHIARSGRCAQLAKISGVIGVFFDDVDHLRAVIARLDRAMTQEGMTPAQNVPARTGDVRAGLSDRCRVDGGRSIDRIWATFLFGLSSSGILVSTDIGVAAWAEGSMFF